MPDQKKLREDNFIKITEGKKVYFIFDYDGTIAEMNPKFNKAFLKDEHVKLLNKLAAHPKAKVAIVTGRALFNLKDLIEGKLDKEILLVGTHGAEIGKERDHKPHEKELEEIRQIFLNEPETEIEEKPLSISIHYKTHPHPQKIREKLYKVHESYQEIFRVQEGHLVFEYLPKDFNKGIAIDYLKENFPDYYPVYFGDDLTDNFAFARVNHFKGSSVQVDTRIQEHVAEFQIDTVQELYALLEKFLTVN